MLELKLRSRDRILKLKKRSFVNIFVEGAAENTPARLQLAITDCQSATPHSS
jgi:hypothetical protein